MQTQIYHPNLFSLAKIRDRGANAENVLNQNRRLILQLIHDTGVVSRKTLAEKTGLKLATITLAINKFLQQGIVKETGLMEGDSGRRIMGFSLVAERACTITIRMSTSYLKVGIYDLNNQNLFIKKVFLNTLSDINHTCDEIANIIEEAKKSIRDRRILGVGVGVEGPFVIKDGFYKLSHPQSPEGYFDLGKVLSDKLGYPIILNRQNNFGVYNLWKTENKDNKLGIFVYLTVSYTVECGIMINGELVNGSSGSAGLVGLSVVGQNALGNDITLNEQCSSTAVLKRVLEALPNYPNSILVMKKDDLNIRDVIKAFDMDDELAVAVFTEVGVHLGRFISGLVNTLNPDYIIFGDEIPQTERMLNIVETEARRHVPKNVKINLHMKTMDYAESRNSKLDPALLGASTYFADAFIQSMDFGED